MDTTLMLNILTIVLAVLWAWLPTDVLRWLTLPPFVVALLYTLDEFRNNVHDIGWRCCLSEWMPENYYLLFALLGIGLTQAALWQHSILLLIAWITVLMAFTVMEFYFRFCSNLAFDAFESWSTDKSRFLLTTSEELRLIHDLNPCRKNLNRILLYNQVYHPRCRVRERRCSPLERLCARGERVRLLLYPATSRLHLETTTVDFGQVAVVKRKVVLPLKRLMSTLGVTTRADGELKTQMRMTLNYGMKPNNK